MSLRKGDAKAEVSPNERADGMKTQAGARPFPDAPEARCPSEYRVRGVSQVGAGESEKASEQDPCIRDATRGGGNLRALGCQFWSLSAEGWKLEVLHR